MFLIAETGRDLQHNMYRLDEKHAFSIDVCQFEGKHSKKKTMVIATNNIKQSIATNGTPLE